MRSIEIKQTIETFTELRKILNSLSSTKKYERKNKTSARNILADIAKRSKKLDLESYELGNIIRNRVTGIFDGFNSEKVENKYLQNEIKKTMALIDTLEGEWKDYLKSNNSQTAKDDKEYEDGLIKLQTLNTVEVKPKRPRYHDEPLEYEDDGEDYSEKTGIDPELEWTDDVNVLNSSTTLKTLKGPHGRIKASVLVKVYIPKKMAEDFEKKGYKCNNVFNEYTHINNATLFACKKKYVQEKFCDGDTDIDYIDQTGFLSFVTSKIKGTGLTISSDSILYKGYVYYLLLPTTKNVMAVQEWQIVENNANK